MSIRFRVGAATDSGRVRDMNQDAYVVMARAVAVADGMGGHRAGDVAARIAVETLDAAFDEPSFESLSGSFVLANAEILGRAAIDPGMHGMGTTMCAVAIIEHDGATGIGVANVGDSRVYRLAAGQFVQLTEDHSLVETMVREGRLTSEEADVHPQRNIVTRALGASEEVRVDQFFFPAVQDDRYLLCSDGLTDEVADEAIAQMMADIPDPSQLVQSLIDAANQSGGRDNITCVVVDIDTGAAAATERPSAPVGVITPATGTAETEVPSLDSAATGTSTDTPKGTPKPTPRAPEAPPAPKRRWWRRD